MNNAPFSSIILLVLYLSTIALSLLYIFRIFRKYELLTTEMKKNGIYSDWAKENKALLFFARLFNYVAVFCLAGFLIDAIYKWSDNPINIFQLFLSFKLVSILLYLILYLKIPKTKYDAI